MGIMKHDSIAVTIVLAVLGVSTTFGGPKPVWTKYISRCSEQPITGRIDLSGLEGSGARVIEDFSGKPGAFGILKRYELILPAFERGCYFSGDAHPEVVWPDGANRTQPWFFRSVGELCSKDYYRRPSNYPRVREGMFLLLELKGAGYFALVPICGPVTMSWLYAAPEGRIVLNVGTLGTAAVSGDVPLFAWCRAEDVYDACREAWREAIECKPVRGRVRLRGDKAYPEPFKYLGWCSWEQYWWDINEKVLTDVVRGIESSGIPIRYVLVDDGHFDAGEDKKLRSFEPNREKFPNGWGPLLALRKPEKVKWMGLWYTASGYWNTVSPENRLGKEVNEHLMHVEFTDALVPRNDERSAAVFYDAMLGAIKRHGFDFVKIDEQARNICWYIGTDNAVEAACRDAQALERAVHKNSKGIINCMAHNLVCTFNTRYSSVTRCSIDYRRGKLARGKSHLLQSYANTLWLGQTVWGDHDMFHSSDPVAGRIMAVSKAVSGGPVYLSDEPNDFVAEYIRPLCYEDGELLRPIAPAAPLPDSVFLSAMRADRPYRVIVPLGGKAAAIVAYDLRHPSGDEPMEAAVTADDYTHAGCMIQPYKGKWKVPAEGLFVYDWYAGKGQKLSGAYRFNLKGFSDRLIHLCPIRKGWAVVGRIDKYLSPASVEVLSVSEGELKLRLAESGPIAIWLESGTPSSDKVSFVQAGKGLWKAEPAKGQRDVVLTIRKLFRDQER